MTKPAHLTEAEQGPQPRLLWLWLALLIVGSSIARIPLVDNDLLGPSEWREVETATIARHFLEEPNIFYPRVNWGAPGPGYVETEFQLMPYVVHLLYRVFGYQPWLGQALALGLAALATWLLFLLARRLMPPWTALAAAAAFGSAPLVFRYGASFMPEALTLVCYIASADRFVVWLQSRRWPAILAAGALLGLGILIKPTSIHLGLVGALVAFQRGGLKLTFGPQMLAFGAVALLPAVFWFTHAAQLHHEYGNTFGVISGGDSKWGGWDSWLDPDFYLVVLQLDVLHGMRYIGTLFVVLALFAARPLALRSGLWTWLAVLLVYYMIVARYAGHESRGLQYHVYAAVPLALAVGAGACALWQLCGRWLSGQLVVRSLVVVLPLSGMLMEQWRANDAFLATEKSDLFLRAGRALASVSDAGDLVLVTSTDVATEDGAVNNFEEPKVMFHAWRRGRIIARDRLTLDELQRVRGLIDARYLVLIDQVFDGADEDLRQELLTWDVAATEDGFHVLRVPQ
ncbi:MAG: glycosyltransferase family 39 protein [Planctomycetota bacterium]|nr:glycosyltransferase family 39 protein [Planctomycetota bacterium]